MRLPPDPAAKAGAGCQDSQGRGRPNRSSHVSFIAISQAADQTSWRLSAMARIVWQQLVAHTLHRPSGCRVSLRASQPRDSSRCRIRLVVMRTPNEKKRNAESSVLRQPPRRGTTEHSTDRRSVFGARFRCCFCGQESEDSGSRFSRKQLFDAFASIQVVVSILAHFIPVASVVRPRWVGIRAPGPPACSHPLLWRCSEMQSDPVTKIPA